MGPARYKLPEFYHLQNKIIYTVKRKGLECYRSYNPISPICKLLRQNIDFTLPKVQRKENETLGIRNCYKVPTAYFECYCLCNK